MTVVESNQAALRPEAHRGRRSLPPAAHGLAGEGALRQGRGAAAVAPRPLFHDPAEMTLRAHIRNHHSTSASRRNRCVAAAVAACAPQPGAGAAKPSQVDVVGSGTIAWRQVAVLAKPKARSRAGRGAEAVPARLPPAVRPRARRRADEEREAAVVPDQHPRASERAHRLGARRRARAPAGAEARDHLPRRAEVRVLGRRAARPHREGSPSARGARRRRSASSTSPTSSTRRSTPTGRSSARTRSRRARTRSSRTGPEAASSACTERRGRISSGKLSRTAASDSTTMTSRSSATGFRSGRRSRSSAEAGSSRPASNRSPVRSA